MISPISAPCLLVAMPSMLDSNFSQSVLLLAEHNAAGAIAFVLNRPSTVSLKSMISIIDRDVPEAIPAWYGGPVDTTTAIILHDKVAQPGDTEISPGISLSTKGKILDSLIEHGSISLQNGMGSSSHPGHEGLSGNSVHPYRFLVGYAGWGAGQLDDELKGGSWLLCPLDRKLVFDTGWTDLWGTCMGKIGMQKNPMVAARKLSGIEYLN